MTKKSWAIVIVLTIAILGGMVWMSRSSKINVDDIDVTKLQPASARNGDIAEHVYGKADSKVVLIEYGDYQCPGCASAAPVMKQVVEKYKDKIAFVFRHKPLTSIHPNALAAAASAEAAGLQGKFWEMHDALYENQDTWKNLSGEERTKYFLTLAKGVGVKEDQFKKDIDESRVRKKIDFDTSLAAKANITGTPAIFLNGKSVDKKFVGDKIVADDEKDARYVWSDATAFENLILLPALREAGITTE